MSYISDLENVNRNHRERAKIALDDVVSSTEELVKCLSGELASSLGDLDDDELRITRDAFKLADSYKRLLVETVTVNLDMAEQINELKKSVDELKKLRTK